MHYFENETNTILGRFRTAFRVYVFLKKKLVHRREWCKIILTFDANAKLFNFTEKTENSERQMKDKGHVVIVCRVRERNSKSLLMKPLHGKGGNSRRETQITERANSRRANNKTV